jgi:hypothetical protein
MEPVMTRKKEDALTSAAAELRSVSLPWAQRLAAQRDAEKRAEQRQRDHDQRRLDAARARLADVAPDADAWFARWVRKGRLDLILRARAHVKDTRFTLERFRITRKGAVWTTEDPHADDGPHRWYDFSVGRTHAIFGGVTGIKFIGGIGGDLGTVRSLLELSRKDMASKDGTRWDGMKEDVLRVGLRVAQLFRDDALEPLLVDTLRRDARWLEKKLRDESQA